MEVKELCAFRAEALWSMKTPNEPVEEKGFFFLAGGL
jgi:hypothetical protein